MPATRTAPARGSDLAPAVKPGPDIFIGLLVISLIAQILACLFLYLDFKDYPDKPPSVPKLQPVGGSAPAPAGGANAATPPAAPAPAAPTEPAAQPATPPTGAATPPAAQPATPPAASPPMPK
jgi:hypothetical protein